MVRRYVRKTNRGCYSESNLKKAMKAAKTMSLRAAGLKYGISHRTLHRHLQKETNVGKPIMGSNAVFNAELELDLIDYVKRMTNTYFGISLRDLRRLAYDFAERNHLTHPFKGNSAGENWSSKFLEDHPEIKIRSLKGPRVSDTLKVDAFYNRLFRIVKHHNIDVNDIYNMDEVGIVSYEGKEPELLQVSGGNQIETIFQNDGQVVAAICCYNITGHFLPPSFVFSCEQIGKCEDILKDVPFPRTLALFSDDGWTNREVFVDWLSFFIQRVRPSKQNKVLLLIDNDEAHVSLAAYDCAIQHGVVLLSVPAYSSEITLPIHFSIFDTIYEHFDKSLRDWRMYNKGIVVTDATIAILFGQAYMKSSSVLSAFESYEESKIYPIEDIDDDPLETFECYDPITSEDEEHLIDVLYQNGHDSTTSEKEMIPSKSEKDTNDEAVEIKRRRKSIPRKCRSKVATNDVEDFDVFCDSS